jgi:hypothetical protein
MAGIERCHRARMRHGSDRHHRSCTTTRLPHRPLVGLQRRVAPRTINCANGSPRGDRTTVGVGRTPRRRSNGSRGFRAHRRVSFWSCKPVGPAMICEPFAQPASTHRYLSEGQTMVMASSISMPMNGPFSAARVSDVAYVVTIVAASWRSPRREESPLSATCTGLQTVLRVRAKGSSEE